MKRLGIAAAAVAVVALGAGPIVAWAARAPAAPAVPPISKAQRDQGMKEAPAAVALAGVPCTVSDAYFVGGATDAKTKVKISNYEVACSGSLGYLVQVNGEAATAYNCVSINELAATDPKNISCRLEGNADPKTTMTPYITAAGRTCTPSAVRAMGATAAGENFYEVACGAGVGYVVKTAAPKSNGANEVVDCAQMVGGNSECTLTPKEQIFARLGEVSKAGTNNCTVNQARYVGSTPTSSFYEVACDGATKVGYMVSLANANGAYENAVECTKASAIGDGCKLTDVTVAAEAEAATYTQLAKANGYPCEVSKYRFIGIDQATKSEVVELACSNRPDGAVALFPAAPGAKGRVMDCVTSGSVGVTCNLSQPTAVMAKYTAGLASKGRTTCKVVSAKWLAATTSGNDLVETACEDKMPGFVMSIARDTGAVAELLTCGQARTAGAACTFPTNTAAR